MKTKPSAAALEKAATERILIIDGDVRLDARGLHTQASILAQALAAHYRLRLTGETVIEPSSVNLTALFE